MEETSDNDKFIEFQIAEYNNIADAHFEVQKQFSIFFRYYVLFISVPLLILTAVIKKEVGLLDILIEYQGLFTVLFLLLGILGFFFGRYMISLKNEQYLYARTVNNIRKYFYSEHGESSFYSEYGMLPKDGTTPSFFNIYDPLLTIIFILNSLFISSSILVQTWTSSIDKTCLIILIILIFIVCLVFHFLTYRLQANRWERIWHRKTRQE